MLPGVRFILIGSVVIRFHSRMQSKMQGRDEGYLLEHPRLRYRKDAPNSPSGLLCGGSHAIEPRALGE